MLVPTGFDYISDVPSEVAEWLELGSVGLLVKLAPKGVVSGSQKSWQAIG